MKDNKQANSNISINNDINISNIEYDIHSVKKALMEERVRVMKSERLETIDSIIRIFEQAGATIDRDTALSILTELK